MSFCDKVIYQIYPKSFCDSKGTGCGDIKGVISKLDYLQYLGVDFVWLTPIFCSPQKDNGYDVADYYNIEPSYGTMEDVETMIAEADKRGIGVMFDMVFNHTSTSHEWFAKAVAGDKAYQDYYFFRNGDRVGKPPTNWVSKFGGSAWEYEPKVGKHYLHLFDKTQADLNWTNPQVRQEMAAVVNFWRGKGVKGFRFDVVNLISKGAFESDGTDGKRFYTDGPRVHRHLQELNKDSFGQDPDCVTVGEMSSTTIQHCLQYAGAGKNELSMVFSFHHLKVDYKDGNKWALKPFDFVGLKQLLFDWQIWMQEGDAWNALFWNNHDQPRAVSRFGNDEKYGKQSAKMLATVIHCLRGTPYIYQGEEIGMTNACFEGIEKYKDVESHNAYALLKEKGVGEKEILRILGERSRDNARTPMQWDGSKNAGFTAGTPWIEVCKNYKKINVKKSKKDKDSVLEHYRSLIQLRKKHKVIAEGRFVPLLDGHKRVLAYLRVLGDVSVMVVCNFFDTVEVCDMGVDMAGYKVFLSNYKKSVVHRHMALRPYESLVLMKSQDIRE
ncbi:MAG: alpha,alpha-phosphotrehalase [Firmicutes bacterium]|nr:alpha,alpha-phosphotrehalase [Bacillota bacterium]